MPKPTNHLNYKVSYRTFDFDGDDYLLVFIEYMGELITVEPLEFKNGKEEK